MEDPSPPTPAAPRPAPRKGCLWLVVAVLTLVLVAFAGLIIFNKQYRLTAAKLQDARARWQAAGLRDYDLEVTVGGGTTGRYQVQIRNGRVAGGTVNGHRFERLEQAQSWTVSELFNILEADLERDAAPGSPAVFTRVEFDAQHGHLVRYVRNQLGGSRQQIEIRVLLTPVE